MFKRISSFALTWSLCEWGVSLADKSVVSFQLTADNHSKARKSFKKYRHFKYEIIINQYSGDGFNSGQSKHYIIEISIVYQKWKLEMIFHQHNRNSTMLNIWTTVKGQLALVQLSTVWSQTIAFCRRMSVLIRLKKKKARKNSCSNDIGRTEGWI